MKRTVMGLIAIVVAVASYAFVTNGNAEEQGNENTYYFYEVVGGVINPNSPLNSTPMTEEEFLNEDLLPCTLGEDTECVRGWASQGSATPTGEAEHVIKKQD